MPVLPQALLDFFKEQQARYGELFWFELRREVGAPTGSSGEKDGQIIVMLERIAAQAREILRQAGRKDLTIVSFEADDSVGEFYVVEAEQIDLETRPSKEEYQSIMDLPAQAGKDLQPDFTDQTNDVYYSQLVRAYQPRGYQSSCLVVLHSFGQDLPSQVGWVKDLSGLRKVEAREFQKPVEATSFEQACKQLEGTRYQIGGGSLRNGFDCSSLVQRVIFQARGFWLPRKAKWQALICNPVKTEELRPGDLAFFAKRDDKNTEIDHVALVAEVQPGKLPFIFHTKRILGKALFQDLNSAAWLYSSDNPLGQWDLKMFGRINEKLLNG